jgi:hypothetical protein
VALIESDEDYFIGRECNTMPVGWKTIPFGKQAVIEKINLRLRNAKEDKAVIVTRAGEAALAGNQTRVDALKAQNKELTDRIVLLTDILRDVESLSNEDLVW